MICEKVPFVAKKLKFPKEFLIKFSKKLFYVRTSFYEGELMQPNEFAKYLDVPINAIYNWGKIEDSLRGINSNVYTIRYLDRINDVDKKLDEMLKTINERNGKEKIELQNISNDGYVALFQEMHGKSPNIDKAYQINRPTTAADFYETENLMEAEEEIDRVKLKLQFEGESSLTDAERMILLFYNQELRTQREQENSI